MTRYLLITILFSITSLSQAGIYKWVDEQGNVHYSQKRPADKQYERIKAPKSAPESAGSPYSSTGSTTEGNATTADKEASKNVELRQQNCEAAKKNMQALQIYRRFKDEQGNVVRMDDKERESKINDAKQAISDFCD